MTPSLTPCFASMPESTRLSSGPAPRPRRASAPLTIFSESCAISVPSAPVGRHVVVVVNAPAPGLVTPIRPPFLVDRRILQHLGVDVDDVAVEFGIVFQHVPG